MGKRIISSDRTRKIRKKKNKILIAVEGKNKTEKLYFNNFDDGNKNYSISFAKGNYTDPFNLVKMLILEMKRIGLDTKAGDRAYCVFDTDDDNRKNAIIDEARKLAIKNNIDVITSTPSIELWFLLHFDYTTSMMTNKKLMDKLKKYYPQYNKNANIYLDINKYTLSAVKRAKMLEQYQLKNGNIIGTVEANPNTEIYKIIEDLLNQ